ncbi:hypothetical protein [Agromyces aureus]|uniref:Uncharacterized protein n=1 Tax=Agromyces aureus TaxID=453304 RepID=A0A191WC03_9MICO|nr:hypothetical protein [Agromyces aureus]ANJ25728.1 hypothetical protein ATC03_02060 [Agromyces aureus]
MAKGDCEAAVATAAAADEIMLSKMPGVEWLNTRGHLHLPARAAAAMPVMERAFELLGGDSVAMQSKRLSKLPNDLLHEASRTMVEVDEFQHFTSMRGLTLDVLEDQSVGYDAAAYRELVRTWHPKSDRYFHSKITRGFPGPFSRGRGRAYFDLLRDVVSPLMGYQVIRVPAVDEATSDSLKGAAAYARSRHTLLALI